MNICASLVRSFISAKWSINQGARRVFPAWLPHQSWPVLMKNEGMRPHDGEVWGAPGTPASPPGATPPRQGGQGQVPRMGGEPRLPPDSLWGSPYHLCAHQVGTQHARNVVGRWLRLRCQVSKGGQEFLRQNLGGTLGAQDPSANRLPGRCEPEWVRTELPLLG